MTDLTLAAPHVAHSGREGADEHRVRSGNTLPVCPPQLPVWHNHGYGLTWTTYGGELTRLTDRTGQTTDRQTVQLLVHDRQPAFMSGLGLGVSVLLRPVVSYLRCRLPASPKIVCLERSLQCHRQPHIMVQDVSAIYRWTTNMEVRQCACAVLLLFYLMQARCAHYCHLLLHVALHKATSVFMLCGFIFF